MPLSFLPRHIYPALTAIDPARLASEGVRLLMLDYCEFCGKPVSDYAKYCRHCGATLEYYKTEPQPEPPREEQVEEKKED